MRLVPQALTTVVEETADVHRFQIVQSGKDHLTLRLDVDNPERKQAAFAIAVQALRGYLANQDIADPHIRLDEHPPTPDVHSGKLRQVIVERDDGR